MAYDPKAIANYFLETAQSKGQSLTPLQVIKLVFCAHGWQLAFTGEPLSFEPPQAWKYGPVFPSLYAAFKEYGDGPISGRAMSYWDYEIEDVPPPIREEQPQVCDLLDQVYKKYGHLSGSQLSTMTHVAGSPWHQAWYELEGRHKKNFVIPKDRITNYYRGLLEQDARSRAE